MAIDPGSFRAEAFGWAGGQQALLPLQASASGGLGGAFVEELETCPNVNRIFALSRSHRQPTTDVTSWLHFDLEDEQSIADAAAKAKSSIPALHMVILASGILHDGHDLWPEKTWQAISGPTMERVFRLNAIGPALVAKHFLPLLTADQKSVFAALSARVGSIQDNQLGGWYSYRASKAALNMLIKTLSIELKRRNPSALCVGLHPGTVDTALSEPFQRSVPEGNLFSASQSARLLLTVLDRLRETYSGGCFAWDGSPIPF